MSLVVKEFDEWMQAVHGQRPFPWQRRLLATVRADGWPSTIKLPTASGKTSAIDVALFGLALEAATGAAPRRMPMRIAFVIDRRIVVDAAHERAERIRQALERRESAVVGRVADALLRLGGRNPVHVAALRGGIYREDRWARQPNQPTIVCSTVDQIGSRVLHRGYGIAPRTWPIHAGLLGNDTLLILDEAHCSQPFLQTLAQIKVLRSAEQRPLGLPWVVTAMTATPADDSEPFELDQEDLADPTLRQRLDAPRPIAFKVTSEPGERSMVASLRDAVVERLQPGLTILAVVNRVRTARGLFESFAKLPAAQRPEAILLTGRVRGLERDQLLASWANRLMAGRDRGGVAQARPLVVVATQCVEVGADLDVDALVTEAAPLDALRQRLGRLNRLGLLATAPCTIVARKELAWDGSNDAPVDAIYGAATARTWRWLTEAAKSGTLDGGVRVFTILAEGHDPNLDAPSAQAPIIFPEYCDLWVQTEPAPAVSPEPSVFLHGPQRGTPEVQVVWRADLAATPPAEWSATIALCPPVAGETLPVRLHVARDWLLGVLKPDKDETADIEGLPDDAPSAKDTERPRPFLVWRGAERSEVIDAPDQVRPGDTIVVPSAYGGCDPFGWKPESTALVVDLADEARLRARRAPVLRLHPSCCAGGPELAMAANEEEPNDLRERVDAALGSLAGQPGAAGTLASLLRVDPKLRVESHPSGHGYVLVGRAGWATDAADFSDEDESSSAAPLEVTLVDHQRDVRDLAGEFAAAVGLAPELVGDLALAGHIHDLGKADPRFQAWLRDGSRLAALRGSLLAKSPRMAPGGRAISRARERARYPVGGRHELLSVRLAESCPEVLAGAHDRELVLHLVESHHGFCRPFAPVVIDDQPLQVQVDHEGHALSASSATQLEHLGSGVADRFFRLLRRYGWWGLSYLEACVRLADHRASELAERSGR